MGNKKKFTLNKANLKGSSSNPDPQQQPQEDEEFRFPERNAPYNQDTQRPPMRSSYSTGPNLHHSSSSLLTISKLYNQQQLQGEFSAPSSPAYQPQQNPKIIPARRSGKQKPSNFDIKNKKLHRRVLSSSSLNDYFSTASKSVDNLTPSSIPEESKAPKLPSFQRVDNSYTTTSNPRDEVPSGFSNPDDTFNEPNSSADLDRLSSSRIFERRMARERQGIEEINDGLLAANDRDEYDEDRDDEVNQMYLEKLHKLREEGGGNENNTMFYTTDSESEVLSVQSDRDEKDNVSKRVDVSNRKDQTFFENQEPQNQDFSSNEKINTTTPSDSDFEAIRSFHPSNTELPRRSSNDAGSSKMSRKGSLISGHSLNSNGEPKFQGFKNVFKRFVLDEEDEESTNLQGFEDKGIDASGGGIFSKLMGFSSSGGGLAPGASTGEEHRPADIENQNQMISADEGIQLQQMDPQIFQREAHDILQAHSVGGSNRRNATVGIEGSSNGLSPSYDASEETTLKGSSSSFEEGFTAPNPDLYIRDEEMTLPHLDDGELSYVPPPERVRGGVLSSLLRLYQNPNEASKSRTSLLSDLSPTPSAVATPINEEDEFPFDQDFNAKSTIGGRLKAFANNAVHVGHGTKNKKKKTVSIDDENLQKQQDIINAHKKNLSFVDASQFSEDMIPALLNKKSKSSTNLPSFAENRPKQKKSTGTSSRLKAKREQAAAKITVHIADILQRQRFIMRMCKALMLYGAPTHRLEEYLTMTARVLEIDGQFMYFPGCMIVSFGDATTRTSEVQLVRAAQGLNLYKLHRVHRIYKKVIHDLIGVEEASAQLDELLAQKPVFPPWACVLLYGFSSAAVTPFAFGGGWVNLPISFGIGICVAILQFYVAPKSNLYSNVFEVAASIVVSFLGRAIGSISGANICFGAIVQGSLALILPGYIILCGSLELQSRNIVAGAVRMFYAIIYSLFLGFGITLGAALYGWIDSNATSEAVCNTKLDAKWNILFVPMFTLGLCLINQARLFQIPIMLFISCVGYIVNYFSAKHFADSTEFTAALGAFVIGIMGNLYSRIWKGLAVSAMLPAIFVQVPGSIASQGSLLAGLESANRLTSNSTVTTGYDTHSLGFGVTMVQIAIGISVGLFASTIFVYPFGKKQTSVFTL